MSTRVEVPTLGESITEATLLQWLKKEGDQVAADEPLCELESDKATVDLPAPASGVLHQKKQAGETAHVGEVIAEIEEARATGGSPTLAAAEPSPAPRASSATQTRPPQKQPPQPQPPPKQEPPRQAEQPPATTAEEAKERPAAEPERPAPPPPAAAEGTRRVPMSKIRRTIAERMLRAQQTTAMLTTFNEIDMTAVQELRSRHQEQFREAHGVPLGLVSFFARASVLALARFPALNAQIEGNDILYHDHVHLGVAVSTERGLVVPVLHIVETMSLARIEKEIKRAAAAARDGKLSLQDLSGGTFTITNGGVFGSLLSTPILNPPQTGILGMHVIQERPVAIERQVQIRPMMYVALTYDHRLVDGHDAVSFLVRLKQLLEDPMQMILEI